MYEMAAQSYYQSLLANNDNIDARIGLKKNGQRLLDQKIITVHNAYDSGDDKKTVYSYLDAKSYQDQLAALSIEIIIPERTPDMFKEAKARYIEKIYNDAQLFVEDEKFSQSEALLAEIKQLEPGYSNSDELMKVSKSEPLYRQGKEFLNTNMYRKAYANFDQIIKNQGTYKDSKDLRDEVLTKGMVTISLNSIVNKTSDKNLQATLESKIRTSLNNLKNPFVKVLDSKNTDQIIEEQQKALNQGSEIQVGKILAAKALFSGSLISLNVDEGKLNKQSKRGYLKEEITVNDPATGKAKKEYRYHKTTYTEYTQSNQVTSTFQYQLTSTETSAILVSDAMDINASDDLNYITFEGNGNMLVPGYWEYQDKDSAKDKINTSPSDVNNFQKLLKANHTLKSVETLQTEVLDNIARKVAQKINSYNPEE